MIVLAAMNHFHILGGVKLILTGLFPPRKRLSMVFSKDLLVSLFVLLKGDTSLNVLFLEPNFLEKLCVELKLRV